VNIYDSKIDFACKWLSKLHIASFKIFLRSLIYVQLCILPKNCSFLMFKTLLHKNLIIYRVSKKKCDLRLLVQNCTFFVQLSCMVFLKYFLKICNFFGTPIAPKKSTNRFSLKIKSSEKQKCVYKLFLSKSKILKRLNHGITKNWQNCNKKIRNF